MMYQSSQVTSLGKKGSLVGQKTPLRLRDIWGIRIRLELVKNVKDLALFDLAIDSKLRACSLTRLVFVMSLTVITCQRGDRNAANDSTLRTIRDYCPTYDRRGSLRAAWQGADQARSTIHHRSTVPPPAR